MSDDRIIYLLVTADRLGFPLTTAAQLDAAIKNDFARAVLARLDEVAKQEKQNPSTDHNGD